MFCPRCGRPVSDAANFCGGCGLPRAEIEKMAFNSQPVSVPVTPVDINDVNATISQLEGDLTGISPVENYTTDNDINTNKVNESFAESEIRMEIGETPSVKLPTEKDNNGYSAQSEYSANVPVHPYYKQSENTDYMPVSEPDTSNTDQNLSTVDFIWMLLIASVPVVGLIYLLYNAFVQQENINKRSWARATLIISLFAFVLTFVFIMGVMMTSFMYW